jgi:hypothetical protein
LMITAANSTPTIAAAVTPGQRHRRYGSGLLTLRCRWDCRIGNLTKRGIGTLTLNNANTYTAARTRSERATRSDQYVGDPAGGF